MKLQPFGLLPLPQFLGVFPIAIQAYQALKVKVVSIDVLVTIAVIGAFLINNFEESAIVTFLFLVWRFSGTADIKQDAFSH
jgi:Cd2+/Zn2+-exporting ATPase